MIWGRLRRPDVLIGLLIVTLLVVCALFADWISPHSATRMVPKIEYLPPAWLAGGDPAYLLGTDQLGRDLLSRIIHGARTSLVIGLSAVAIAATAGVALGLVAGYFRGWVDVVIMRLADVQLAFPFILLALAILAVSETKSALTIIIVLGVANWVIHARVTRGRVLVEREKEYVRGARALGASHTRTMLLYILPALLPTAIVIAMIELAILMLVESILAFIGLGIDPPAVSWGTLLARAASRTDGGCWCFRASRSSSRFSVSTSSPTGSRTFLTLASSSQASPAVSLADRRKQEAIPRPPSKLRSQNEPTP